MTSEKKPDIYRAAKQKIKSADFRKAPKFLILLRQFTKSLEIKENMVRYLAPYLAPNAKKNIFSRVCSIHRLFSAMVRIEIQNTAYPIASIAWSLSLPCRGIRTPSRKATWHMDLPI
jgi:hypothetical protein